jgi:hypothetical protein
MSVKTWVAVCTVAIRYAGVERPVERLGLFFGQTKKFALDPTPWDQALRRAHQVSRRMGMGTRLRRAIYVASVPTFRRTPNTATRSLNPPNEPEDDQGLTPREALIVVLALIAACAILVLGVLWLTQPPTFWFSK